MRDGEVLDFGYGEFVCTPTTAKELMEGGMTHVNGQRVVLEIVDRLPASNAVVMRFFSADGDDLRTEWSRFWAEKKVEA